MDYGRKNLKWQEQVDKDLYRSWGVTFEYNFGQPKQEVVVDIYGNRCWWKYRRLWLNRWIWRDRLTRVGILWWWRFKWSLTCWLAWGVGKKNYRWKYCQNHCKNNSLIYQKFGGCWDKDDSARKKNSQALENSVPSLNDPFRSNLEQQTQPKALRDRFWREKIHQRVSRLILLQWTNPTLLIWTLLTHFWSTRGGACHQ